MVLVLFGALLTAGCGGSSGGSSYDGNSTTAVNLKGTVSTSSGSSSMRETVRGATSKAAVSLHYFDEAGDLQPLTKDYFFDENNGQINYDLAVYIPNTAMDKHNFVLKTLVSGVGEIMGVLPFDPRAERGQILEFKDKITPDHKNIVELAKMAAKGGVPNINMMDALSVYTPQNMSQMNQTNLEDLFKQMKAKHNEMQTAMQGFGADQAEAAKKLNAYAMELGRDPNYMGFDNRAEFEAAMSAKAKELGLTNDSRAKLDGATNAFFGGDLPIAGGMTQEVFNTIQNGLQNMGSSENPMDENVNYFAEYYTDDETLQELKVKYHEKVISFYALVRTGNPPINDPNENPALIAQEVRDHVFEKIDPMSKLGGETAFNTSPIDLTSRINMNYEHLEDVPADGAKKTEFVEMLVRLAGMSLPTQQGGNNQGGNNQGGGQFPPIVP